MYFFILIQNIINIYMLIIIILSLNLSEVYKVVQISPTCNIKATQTLIHLKLESNHTIYDILKWAILHNEYL